MSGKTMHASSDCRAAGRGDPESLRPAPARSPRRQGRRAGRGGQPLPRAPGPCRRRAGAGANADGEARRPAGGAPRHAHGVLRFRQQRDQGRRHGRRGRPRQVPGEPIPRYACASRGTRTSVARASTTSVSASGARRRCAARCCCRARPTRRSHRQLRRGAARGRRTRRGRVGQEPACRDRLPRAAGRRRRARHEGTDALPPWLCTPSLMLALLRPAAPLRAPEEDPVQLKLDELDATRRSASSAACEPGGVSQHAG